MMRTYRALPQAALIHHLNPILRGWANYFSTVCSKRVFSKIDHQVYLKLRAWVRRRHPHKSRHWHVHKYWLVDHGGGWTFAARSEQSIMLLFTHVQTPIKRHTKVQNSRSPYDGDLVYWSRRLGRYPLLRKTVARLLKKQSGKCAYCGLIFRSQDLMEVHHLDNNHLNNKQVNLRLIHRHCHD